MDRPRSEEDDLSRVVEAADRAGAIVTDHVRSIVDAAQARADEIERAANAEANEVRRNAEEAARRVLERIDAMEGSLGSLVATLRKEADIVSSQVQRRS